MDKDLEEGIIKMAMKGFNNFVEMNKDHNNGNPLQDKDFYVAGFTVCVAMYKFCEDLGEDFLPLAEKFIGGYKVGDK